jgi:hypothetical protein
MRILEAIDLNETIPIVALIYLLAMVGSLMIPQGGDLPRWAARIAGGTFVLYAIAGLVKWPPRSMVDVLVIVVKAILAGGLLWSVSRIALPAVFFIYERLIGDALREAEKAEERRYADQWWFMFDWIKKREFAEQQRLEEEAQAVESAPRPIDVEAVARDAKQRYERKLAVIDAASMGQDEREAAKRKAHQQYLRDLDGAL